MNIRNLKEVLFRSGNACNMLNKQDWEKAENELGIEFPIDYKGFVDDYGVGCIDNFLWIYTPYSNNENFNLLKQVEVINNAYLEMKEEFPEVFLFDVFPKKGGLLPFGGTENGDVLYWLTNEDNKHWSIIVYDDRHSEYVEYNKSFTDFLYELLTKKLVCPIFPEGFPKETPQYYSYEKE